MKTLFVCSFLTLASTSGFAENSTVTDEPIGKNGLTIDLGSEKNKKMSEFANALSSCKPFSYEFFFTKGVIIGEKDGKCSFYFETPEGVQNCNAPIEMLKDDKNPQENWNKIINSYCTISEREEMRDKFEQKIQKLKAAQQNNTDTF